MKLDEKLIKRLADGEIAMAFDAENIESAKIIARKTGKMLVLPDQSKGKRPFMFKNVGGKLVIHHTRLDLPIVDILDFYLIKPKLKVGDLVRHRQGLDILKIERIYYNDFIGEYVYVTDQGNYISGKQFIKVEDTTEFEIGKEYEFIYSQASKSAGWTKGKLLAIVDNQYKYIVKRDGIEQPCSYDMARHIKREPTPIVRWINVYPDGSIGANVFDSAPQAMAASSYPDTKTIPLTGEIPAEE